ncbi:hypothetical protein TUBRATIS_009850 [Tubulinosema ratisbonensis]|uniref:Uncharacterized protein n=1 Tax=Tubulinosema ratisbonensis TaxID=291195 RepID=A0A437AMQ9_9MICR|nr:hypothetical protein TUBRATIS_009850 [Tubulinosema ratisbonensis]
MKFIKYFFVILCLLSLITVALLNFNVGSVKDYDSMNGTEDIFLNEKGVMYKNETIYSVGENDLIMKPDSGYLADDTLYSSEPLSGYTNNSQENLTNFNLQNLATDLKKKNFEKFLQIFKNEIVEFERTKTEFQANNNDALIKIFKIIKRNFVLASIYTREHSTINNKGAIINQMLYDYTQQFLNKIHLKNEEYDSEYDKGLVELLKKKSAFYINEADLINKIFFCTKEMLKYFKKIEKGYLKKLQIHSIKFYKTILNESNEILDEFNLLIYLIHERLEKYSQRFEISIESMKPGLVKNEISVELYESLLEVQKANTRDLVVDCKECEKQRERVKYFKDVFTNFLSRLKKRKDLGNDINKPTFISLNKTKN